MTDAILTKGEPTQVEPAKSLSVADMLDAADIEYTLVPVPEWGGDVKLGSITAGDMLEELDFKATKGDRESTIRLVVRSLVNADGSRVPVDAVEDLVTKFKKKDVRVMNRLAEAALILNGVRTDRIELKNVSGEASSAASPTVSQPPVA